MITSICTKSSITSFFQAARTRFFSTKSNHKLLTDFFGPGVRRPSVTAGDITQQILSFIEQGTKFQKTYFGENKSEQAKTWGEKCKATSQFIKDGFNLVISGYTSLLHTPSKVKYEKEYVATRYLPEKSRQALNAYWQTPGYWFNRFWNPQKVQLEETLLKGPVAIKSMQSEVEAFNRTVKPQLEEMLKGIENHKDISDFLKSILKYQPQKQLNEFKAKEALLSEVPGVIGKQFDAPKKALIQAYNASHSSNKIKEETVQAIKAGSIGQVFMAETQDGKKVVLKVIKPGIDKNFLGAHESYLYFQGLVDQGLQAKGAVASNAKATVRMLQEEIQASLESQNTKSIGTWTAKNTSTLKVPEILASTEHGLVMPYVGEEDLIKLSVEEQNAVKQQIGADLTKLFVLSPHKPMDLHSGNVRVGPKDVMEHNEVFLIDHGRQANINAAMNEDLLKLMTHVYKQAEGTVPLVDPDMREQLKTLLLHNEQANKVHLSNLAKIETVKSNTDLTGEREKAHKALQTLLDQLFTRTIPAQNGFAGGKLVSIPERKVPTVLSVWSNAAQILPGFSEKTISKDDIKMYLDKSKAFMQPYFETYEGRSPYAIVGESLATELLKKADIQSPSSSMQRDLKFAFWNALEADMGQ